MGWQSSNLPEVLQSRAEVNNAYHQGRRVHREQRNRDANPYATMTKWWAWWLAGWNDRDRGLIS